MPILFSQNSLHLIIAQGHRQVAKVQPAVKGIYRSALVSRIPGSKILTGQDIKSDPLANFPTEGETLKHPCAQGDKYGAITLCPRIWVAKSLL
jgi:hypothetical protein